ncbi:hypothetical protein MASR2M39_31110 [Ignavibacteriales bacterium]
MNSRKWFNALILALPVLVFTGCKSDSPNGPVINPSLVSSNITISNDIGDPPVNNSVETIELTFSEVLDTAGLTDFVKVYRIDSTGNPINFPVYVSLNQFNKSVITIKGKPVKRFADGMQYKIEINGALKTKSGISLGSTYIGYFATNRTFSFLGDPTLNLLRTQIVVISDIHLGMDNSFSEINANRAALVSFLTKIKNSPNVKELVIAGDMIDQWFVPMEYQPPTSEAAFVDAIAANNSEILDVFKAIIAEGQIKLTYTPGNHDILVTAEDMQRILPGINQARGSIQGIGEYKTGLKNEIIIEHGHKYNIFVAPDPISNRNITGNTTSILPPGYFFTRIATSSVVQGKPVSPNVWPDITYDKNDPMQELLYLYYQTWKSILVTLPIKQKFSDKVMTTNIDGFTANYSVNDILPQVNPTTGKLEVVLFDNMLATWDQRQTMNGVKVKTPVKDAIILANDSHLTDNQSKFQYFDTDGSIRIVIFGHTHEARILQYKNLEGKKTIYANSGTWIDHSLSHPGMIFTVVYEASAGSPLSIVNNYQYSTNGSVTQWGTAQAIINY